MRLHQQLYKFLRTSTIPIKQKNLHFIAKYYTLIYLKIASLKRLVQTITMDLQTLQSIYKMGEASYNLLQKTKASCVIYFLQCFVYLLIHGTGALSLVPSSTFMIKVPNLFCTSVQTSQLKIFSLKSLSLCNEKMRAL